MMTLSEPVANNVGVEDGIAHSSWEAASSAAATFATQANAFVRKNIIFQMRNYKTNVCVITFPILICGLLFGLQIGINKLLDKPKFKCGCQKQRVNGSLVELCGLPYTTEPAQTNFCPVDHPPAWPALMQVPYQGRGRNTNDTFSAFSRQSFPGPAILYTGDDPQTAAALANGLLQSTIDDRKTDPLMKYTKVVAGSSRPLKETLILEQAFVKNEVYVLRKERCTRRIGPDELSFTYNLAGMEVPFNGTPRCLQTRLQHVAGVAAINLKVYRSAQIWAAAGHKRDNNYVTAYDFGDTSVSSNNPRFNVSVFYNAYSPQSFTPPEYYRVSRPMNLAAQAFVHLLAGPQEHLSLWFVKEMPKAASKLLLDFSVLLGPLFYMWVSALLLPVGTLLLPVIMTTLVYEKQNDLRMMMKMHGLGDGAYWVITYGYFLVLSLLYFLAFVAIGSAVDLKFFRLNSYSIQFVFFFIYMNLQIAFSFFAATLFQNSKTATVCGYMYVFGFGLLGHFFFLSYLQDKHTARGWIFAMELLPPFSLYRGLYELQQYATVGYNLGTSGMQWGDLDDEQNGMKTVFLIQTVEWFMFLVIAFYLDQVLPASGSGMRRHPLFFFGYSRTLWEKSGPKLLTSELQEGSQPTTTSDTFTVPVVEMEKLDLLAEVRTELMQNQKKSNSNRDLHEWRCVIMRARVERLRNMPSNCAIVCDNLKKVYPGTDGNPNKYAVRGVSLAVERGECFGMLGPNGAGKSTIINMMIGLIPPTSGSAYIHGLDIRKDMNRIYRSMGVCPQHDLLWEQLTGKEHLLFYGRLKNLKGRSLSNAVNASLESVNLFDRGVGDKRVAAYSGGMKRRLSVAISLIGDPKVVYMDEPGTGLDPASRKSLWNIVKEAKKDRAIILTTHSMEEAEALCDRLCIVANGQLQCIGNSKELTNRYGGVYVLTIATPEEEEQDVVNLVQTLSPRSQKIYGLAGTQKFEIPKAGVKIGRIFSAVVEAKKKLHIQPWGISDATLEDVFIKVARDAQQEDTGRST